MTEISAETILHDLRTDGIAMDYPMPKAILDPIIRHISKRPVYSGHVWAQSDRIGKGLNCGLETLCSTQETVLTAPGFLKYVDQATPYAEAYLQEPALLYSVNAFWTAPGKSDPHPYYQQGHRDQDDRKFLAMFIYGSDVLEEADGPHVYTVGSHKPDFRSIDQRRVMGRAGTTFFADTSGIHYGAKPRQGRRLILWARWGVSEPPQSYINDELKPIDRKKVPYAYADHLRLVMR